MMILLHSSSRVICGLQGSPAELWLFFILFYILYLYLYLYYLIYILQGTPGYFCLSGTNASSFWYESPSFL